MSIAGAKAAINAASGAIDECAGITQAAKEQLDEVIAQLQSAADEGAGRAKRMCSVAMANTKNEKAVELQGLATVIETSMHHIIRGLLQARQLLNDGVPGECNAFNEKATEVIAELSL